MNTTVTNPVKAVTLIAIGLAIGGHGHLCGRRRRRTRRRGMGMLLTSLMTMRDNGVIVAVTSNMSHANTSALASQIATRSRERRGDCRGSGQSLDVC
jgi:hypothetical protein